MIQTVWASLSCLGWRSFIYNQEINAVILGPQFSAQMQSMILRRTPLGEGKLSFCLSASKSIGSMELGMVGYFPDDNNFLVFIVFVFLVGVTY